MQHTSCLIIGGGPAGYTAAIYAARAALGPIVLLGWQAGGQLMITTDVENFPGFERGIQGPLLMEQMHKQAVHVGARLIEDHVKEVDLSKKPFLCHTEQGLSYTTDVLIIATGAQAKWLGIDSEKKFQGFGVSGCATCDGMFFKDKNVCVVGGGDTAVEEALYLSNLAKTVTVIHRRDKMRAHQVNQQRLLAHPKIHMIWNSELEEVLGETQPHKKVTGIRVKDLLNHSTKELPVDGVFIAIGHSPETALFKGQLELDGAGYIKVTPGKTATSVPGVFACGDVCDSVYRQAITAAGLGCMAALDAYHYLQVST